MMVSAAKNCHQHGASICTLSSLLDGVVDAAEISTAMKQQAINDIVLDSRQVGCGALFVAMPGALADGRRFIAQAIASGAAAVVYERQDMPEDMPDDLSAIKCRQQTIGIDNLRGKTSLIAGRLFGHPSRALSVIAITGTNAKTTCAYLLSQALNLLGENSAMMGTIGSGRPDQLIESELTTNDAIETQRRLQQLVANGVASVCMEVSSHALVQERLAAIDINVAVFTNLTQDHLDYHQSMARYAKAKQKLFCFDSLEAVVINADDTFGQQLLETQNTTSRKVLSYGQQDAAIRPQNLTLSADGISFDIEWDGDVGHMRSGLLGGINVANILAIVATLLARGFAIAQIAMVLPRLKAAPGRMELFAGSAGVQAVVDYSHTPDSLERALESLRTHCHGKLWVVFGCGGDRDPNKRSLMGAVAAGRADQVVITNDNPRSESPQKIVDQIIAGMVAVRKPDRSWCNIILPRRAAIRFAIQAATTGDTVLIAGKGHESVQVIGNRKLPFSDRRIVRGLMEIQS